MKKFAIIGLGAFGSRIFEELLYLTDDIIIIDKDPNIIKKYEKSAKKSFIFDVTNEDLLQKALSQQGLAAAIVDLGGKIELAIMVTTYLKKMHIKEIVVKAESDQHERVLSIVGATNVIFPDREAAKRVGPMLASSLLFNFMPISANLALAEVGIKTDYVGKTLLEADLRKKAGLNVVAVRKNGAEDFDFINDPQYCFATADILLVAGAEKNIFDFSHHKKKTTESTVKDLFRSLFPRREK